LRFFVKLRTRGLALVSCRFAAPPCGGAKQSKSK
jgi:hypothetical protein